jgi:hypothetical protein
MVAGTSASQSQGRAMEDEKVYTRLRRSFDRLGMAPEKANATWPSTAASNAAKPIMIPAAARPWHGCASTPSHVLESWRAAVVMRAPSPLVCKSLDFVRRSMPDFAIHRTAIARAKHDRRGGSDSVIGPDWQAVFPTFRTFRRLAVIGPAFWRKTISAGPRMRALKSSSDFRSRVNSDCGDRGLPCQPRIRWDSRSRTMIPAFGRGSSKRRCQSD